MNSFTEATKKWDMADTFICVDCSYSDFCLYGYLVSLKESLIRTDQKNITRIAVVSSFAKDEKEDQIIFFVYYYKNKIAKIGKFCQLSI